MSFEINLFGINSSRIPIFVENNLMILEIRKSFLIFTYPELTVYEQRLVILEIQMTLHIPFFFCCWASDKGSLDPSTCKISLEKHFEPNYLFIHLGGNFLTLRLRNPSSFSFIIDIYYAESHSESFTTRLRCIFKIRSIYW